MYKIRVTELAHEDLEQIISYIACTLASPAAATAFADKVADCYSQLEKNPLMYELCRNDQLRKLFYRRAVIKKYIMVYRVEESSKTVYILRFFYGKLLNVCMGRSLPSNASLVKSMRCSFKRNAEIL